MEDITKYDVLSWSAFIGCMFIGMGIGDLFDQTGAGMLIGLGVGYFAEAIIESKRKKGSESNITS